MHNTTTQDLLSGKLPTQHLDVKTIGLECELQIHHSKVKYTFLSGESYPQVVLFSTYEKVVLFSTYTANPLCDHTTGLEMFNHKSTV